MLKLEIAIMSMYMPIYTVNYTTKNKNIQKGRNNFHEIF